ncbi:uncharacterized protein [Argopecten irradians]|uniref:uncharacterized protein n=1 Tax=Argopecten irradians TaxID=31199 RepID=UPI00371B082A
MQRSASFGALVLYCFVFLVNNVQSQPLHCGKKQCDNHHDSCQYVNNDHWHCVGANHCGSDCDLHHLVHECCCHTQNCLDSINHHQEQHTTQDPFATLGVQMVCGPDICNTREEPYCVLKHHQFHCDHHCDQAHLCQNQHPDPGGNFPDCCCTDQACVDHVLNTTHVEIHGIRCPDCPNVQNNECHGDPHHRCSPHEMCKAIVDKNGVKSTHCQQINGCLLEQIGSIFSSSTEKRVCCDTQLCLYNAAYSMNSTTTTAPSTTAAPAVSHATTLPTTTPTPLYCPNCGDAFTGNCTQNSKCASNEGCMLLVNNGKLQTGCVEINDCQYHERIGDSVCCTDKNCTDRAFQLMKSTSFFCPSCVNTKDPASCMNMQTKCSYLSKGCMVTQSQLGVSSGCSIQSKHCATAEAANSPLCHAHPIPFSFSPGLQCSFCCHNNDSTCIVDALGVHDVTPAPTHGTGQSATPTSTTVTGNTGSCVDHDDASFSCQDYNTHYQMCSSTDPMMKHLVDTKCQKTCGKCPAALCEDKIGTCAGMASFLCAATDPTEQEYAQKNCAKTCNHCPTVAAPAVSACADNDTRCTGMAAFICTTTDPISHTFAKEHCAKTCNLCSTTVTKPPAQCVDHDVNNNCLALASQICTSQDTHVKNFAIATCAKTCNLCTEYTQHLQGLTIPLLG